MTNLCSTLGYDYARRTDRKVHGLDGMDAGLPTELLIISMNMYFLTLPKPLNIDIVVETTRVTPLLVEYIRSTTSGEAFELAS